MISASTMALAEGLLQMGSRGQALAHGQLRLAAVAGRAFFSRSISQNSQFDEVLFFLCVAAGKHKGKTVPRQTFLFRLVFARHFFFFCPCVSRTGSRGRALADRLSRTGSRERARKKITALPTPRLPPPLTLIGKCRDIGIIYIYIYTNNPAFADKS